MGPGCEAAALTAELLIVAFMKAETVEEVSQVLSLTDAHLDPNSWVPRWFLSLGDPTSICLSGWHVFFKALEKALEGEGAEGAGLAFCPTAFASSEALGLLHGAAETAQGLSTLPLGWQQAVGQRLVKDRLRHGFELLSQARHEAEMPLVSQHRKTKHQTFFVFWILEFQPPSETRNRCF